MLTVLAATEIHALARQFAFAILSVLEAPLSLPVVRSGVEGAAGATVSMVMLRAPEATLVLPAASVAWAAMLWAPERKRVVEGKDVDLGGVRIMTKSMWMKQISVR